MNKLRDYQIEAIKKMKNGCILCGGVGSGKSKTALAYYIQENDGDVISDVSVPMGDPPLDLYIITTARKRDTLEWDAELADFGMSIHPDTNLYSNKIVIDSWNNIKKYQNIFGAFFIFDEQKAIGRGAWVKAFLKIAKKNRWIILSATPGDTWQDYIPVFIANGFYKNRQEFIDEHIVYKRNVSFPQIDRYLETGKLIQLRNKILVGMDFKRVTQSHHEDIYTEYDMLAYRTVSKDRLNIFTNEPIKNASEFCYTLRKIVNSDDSRVVALCEILEKHPKAIIFYSFDYELEILRSIALPGMKVAEWNSHLHQPIPEGNSWIYLVQYYAGCEGWNCITTDTIIFYSQSYSYKVMEQACGRIDRLNTPFLDLYYYHLKSRSNIDLAISRALKKKKQFNEGAYYNEH